MFKHPMFHLPSTRSSSRALIQHFLTRLTNQSRLPTKSSSHNLTLRPTSHRIRQKFAGFLTTLLRSLQTFSNRTDVRHARLITYFLSLESVMPAGRCYSMVLKRQQWTARMGSFLARSIPQQMEFLRGTSASRTLQATCLPALL